MDRIIYTQRIRIGRRKGELVEGKVGGRTVRFRKAKYLPKGCKAAKRICISCLKTPIRKTESNYELKICKGCLSLREGPKQV